MNTPKITADTIVNDAVKDYPQVLYVFQAVGIDTCCGGALAIGEASRRHGIDEAGLLQSIETAIATCACKL
jgi:iron-sulfur cluster repair protein YtfE (RIC family)